MRRFRDPFVAINRIGEPAFGVTISGEPLLLYAESSDEPFDMRLRAIVCMPVVVVLTIRDVILFCNARRSRALGLVGSVLSPTDTTSISSSTEIKENQKNEEKISIFFICILI